MLVWIIYCQSYFKLKNNTFYQSLVAAFRFIIRIKVRVKKPFLLGDYALGTI